MTEENQGHFIVPPTDEKLRCRLALKLKEYLNRVVGKREDWEFMHPKLAHLTYSDYRDSCYKAYILEAVLKSNEPVDTWKLRRELHDRWNDAFNIFDFCNACGVIDKYCGNIPDQPFLTGGTLPELPEPEDRLK